MNLGELINENTKESFELDELSHIDHEALIDKPEDTDKQIKDFFTGRISRGLGTGYHLIDQYLVFKHNSLFANVGRKGRGKTTVDQILRLMWALNNGIVTLCSYYENENWQVKLTLLGYLLGENPKDVEKKDNLRYISALDFINNHFIFTKADTKRQILLHARKLISVGVRIDCIVLDPVNSIDDGFNNTGNAHEDGIRVSKEVLKYAKKHCSVFVSQHPTMYMQRGEEEVLSEHAEGGYYFNKAHVAYSLNRDRESNDTRIRIESVRNKLTGGNCTSFHHPLIMHWDRYDVDFSEGDAYEANVIGRLVSSKFPHFRGSNNNVEHTGKTPNIGYEEAFGEESPF